MIITRVDIIPVVIPRKKEFIRKIAYGTFKEAKFVVIKVHTDEGIVGIGESNGSFINYWECQETIAATLHTYIAPMLLKEDPFNLEKIWLKMNAQGGGGGYIHAKAGIDIALYDIMGKTLGIPIHKLMGGLSRDRFPVIGFYVGLGTIEQMVKAAEKLIAAGHNGLRVKIGQGLKEDENIIRSIREALGKEIHIRVDANQSYMPYQAIKFIKILEKYDIEFVEQPTPWYDLRGMAEIVRAVNIPIMAHESLYSLADVVQHIAYRATDILGLKIYRPGGGITNAKKVISLAELMNIPCMVHSTGELGISTAASAHLVASHYKNMKYVTEMTTPFPYVEDIVRNPIKIENGYVEVPKTPGLGVELDEEKIAKYALKTLICQ
ncbi:MAG: mandelate racemase/muconate lactonizing enzyme family protein [Candidatus Bathyarchaeota archaeon]|nr:MAG: mandelate racemase/muconate lactonizing enzyme family protein [Candidatus Bathyarchaeota archaeon]